MRRLMVLVLAVCITACSPSALADQVLKNASVVAGSEIPVTSSQPFGGCGGALIDPINSAFEQAVVEQTNAIRVQNGLSPLKRVEMLDLSARYHSADMSVNGYFDHNTLGWNNGRLSEVCDTWNRIEAYYTNWEALAENIAAGQRTPAMAMDGWMNSPDHRHNILSDNYSEIGVGYYEGPGEYRYYWDQNFGNRAGVFPIVVDLERAWTSIPQNVPVYLYGNFERVRLRNDGGPWSDWLPFAHNLTWDLPTDPGLHTVTAEMEGADGQVTTADTIEVRP